LVAIWERAHRRGGFGRQEGVEAEVLAFERRIDVPILDRGSGDALVEEKLMFVQSQEEDGVLPLVRAGKIANAAMEEYHADPSCWEGFSEDRHPGSGVCVEAVRPEGRVMAPFFHRGDLL